MTPRPSGPAAHLSDLRLAVPALTGWGVLALSLTAGIGLHVWVAAGALGGCGALLWRRRGRSRGHDGLAGRGGAAALGLCVVALLQVAVAGHLAVRRSGDLEALATARASVRLVVVVTSDPVSWSVSGRDAQRVSAHARAVAVTGRGRSGAAHAPVLLVGDDRLLRVRWHEEVEVPARLAPGDPGRGDLAVATVTGDPVLRAPPGLVAQGAERLRVGLRDAVRETPADARGLLPGLVIGDTSQTPPDLTEAMLATGMTHLSAVSGANVAVVLALVLGACTLVGVPRVWRPVLALVTLAGFVVLARPEPSVVRAGVMGAVALIGQSRSRAALGLPVLGAAVVLLLTYDPWLARSFGFVLSSLATLGLLLFTRPWGEAIGARLPGRLRALGPAVAVPVAAQVMCAPVIVLLQGSVSVFGVLANLLAAPLVPAATIAGVVAALADLVSPELAALVGTGGAVPTLGIARIARTFADVPGATMPWPDGGTGALLLTGLVVLGVLGAPWLGSRVARRPVATLGLVLLVAGGTVPTATVTWPPEGWRLVACDVGQGDAIVVRSGPARAVLVDAGPDPRLVDHCLDRLGVDVLDAVVLTHFHADHVEGLPGALAGRPAGEILTSPVAEPTYQVAEVRRWAGARGIPVRALAAGDRLDVGWLHATVLSPVRRIGAGSVPNNASVVLSVHDGALDALLLGDIEREAAHDLRLRLRRDPVLAAETANLDVVKVAHHGSANLDADLVREVRAPVAIISVGTDNDYGHPAPSTLALLRADGYAVYRTDTWGDVAVLDRGGQVLVRPARS